MKRDFLTDIQDNIYKNNDNIASLIPYLYEGIGYSLQIDATPLLRKYVAAAILKYKNDSVSFEDILEDLDINDFLDEKSYSQHEMVRHVIVHSAVMNTKIIEEYLKSTKVKQANKDLFFISMGRLSTSFKSATLLLNNGFFVEVVTIFRLIIEQLAWGSFLLCEEDEKKNRENTHAEYGQIFKEPIRGILWCFIWLPVK